MLVVIYGNGLFDVIFCHAFEFGLNLVSFGWCIVFILSEAGQMLWAEAELEGGCQRLLATTGASHWWPLVASRERLERPGLVAPAVVSTQASRDRNSHPQCRGKGRGTASGPPTHV